MDDAAVLDVLARADRAAELPQLGGMARPDGVAIVSDGAWALAVVGGGVEVRDVPRRPIAARAGAVRARARQ